MGKGPKLAISQKNMLILIRKKCKLEPKYKAFVLITFWDKILPYKNLLK